MGPLDIGIFQHSADSVSPVFLIANILRVIADTYFNIRVVNYGVQLLMVDTRHILDYFISSFGPVELTAGVTNRPLLMQIGLKRIAKLAAFTEEMMYTLVRTRTHTVHTGARRQESLYPPPPTTLLGRRLIDFRFYRLPLRLSLQSQLIITPAEIKKDGGKEGKEARGAMIGRCK